MLSKIAYYCFVFPLSFFPLRLLYVLSDLLFIVFFYLLSYRKKIIYENLTRSFPEKSKSEIKAIAKQFYRHFSDLLIEGIKNLSISEKELKKRMQVENAELMHDFHKKGLSVLLVSGHYNNWEWLITAQNFLFEHQAVGVGQPMTSKFWDKKVNQRRERFGMRVINAKNLKEKLALWSNEQIAILNLSDQSPANSHKSYWMQFLNQQTAVLFGTELLAHQHNMAVVYFEIKKVKRGYYKLNLQLITENPKTCTYGEITEKHTRLLEATIESNPAFWLWSHKRWKRTIPKNLEGLRRTQKKQFEAKFSMPNL